MRKEPLPGVGLQGEGRGHSHIPTTAMILKGAMPSCPGLWIFLCDPLERAGEINAPAINSSLPWICLQCSAVAKLQCEMEEGGIVDLAQPPWAEESGSGWANGSCPGEQCRVD